MEIKEGMIGFSGGELFIQKAIMYFTNSSFSHSFMVRNNDDGVPCALETSSTRVMFEPVANKLNEKNWVEMWDVIHSPQNKRIALNDCMIYNKQWYAYLSYIWFMYRWACRKFFRYEPKKMWWWCKPGRTCTELTEKYPSHYLMFPELFKSLDPDTLSPRELRDIMIANPDKFVCLGWYFIPQQ
jgi:hypothetical protein